MSFLRRTWAEISKSALIHNLEEIKKNAKGSAVYAVVKANAYGHGADLVAPLLQQAGVSAFAASNIEEAIELRNCGIKGTILILGYTPANMAEELSKADISQCVYSLEYARDLSEYAAKAGVFVKIHLKLDTGMARLGFDARSGTLSGISEAITAAKLDNLMFEGVFTHFSSADSDANESMDFTAAQYDRFIKGVNALKSAGLDPQFVHCDNSAAICKGEYTQNAVRPGIILYGLTPDRDFDPRLNLLPVMTLKSVVSFVKTVKAGTPVSYGRTFTAKKDMKIATVSAGYADGYPRKLSNKGEVLIAGRKVPVIGRVCMDQIMIDVTGIDGVKTGDEVILFGKDLSVDNIAKMCDTINYEIVCGVSHRVPRVLVD